MDNSEYFNQYIPLDKNISTQIRETANGCFQVGFTIKNQTFYLANYNDDVDSVKWMEIQLKKALTQLKFTSNGQ